MLAALLLQGCGENGKSKKDGSGNAIKKARVVESFDTSRRIGAGGEISFQWKKSDSLCAHVSTEELTELASKHNNEIERLIAFRALLMKNSHEAVSLAISEIEDTTIVHTTSGCCGSEDMASNIRIEMIQYNREQYHVSKEDSVRLDSAVLFSENGSKFDYSNDLYHRLPARPEYENRLWQLYEHTPYALIPLAKYRKEEVKKEIVRLLRLLTEMNNKDLWPYCDTIRSVLDAVVVWPSPSYKQQVRHICQKVLNNKDRLGFTNYAFGALMAYNDQWSYNCIDKALSKSKQREKLYYDDCWSFHEAYEDNPQPLFKPLIKKYPIE